MTIFEFTQEILVSPSGAALNLFSSNAGPDAIGVVQINHGLAEHAVRYKRFARFLQPHGYHVYAHDHRGHGASSAPDAPPKVFAASGGADKVLEDVAAVHNLIADRHGGLPVICFGHSMGGLVAMNFAFGNSERLAGLCCWNANFSAGLLGRIAQLVLAWERFRLGSDVPSRILPKLTFQAWAKQFPDRKTDFDWLSRDEDEVAKYIADPLSGWDASVSMWQDVFDLIFRGADDANVSQLRRDLPVNLVGGERDPATDGGSAVLNLYQRMQKMGFSDLTFEIYRETRHESLNEINRDDIMSDFLAWAGDCVAARR
ncbi:MAG: alpha/beta fold hydrolase [Rhizobiaceae bacterium]